ncbi:MAG: class I SAM-dependent methyltransferase [Gemmobacter sp.]|uniref:class I SAM-dependent methyltransferase n=1 Tax=Gemmobacter sp. TaxID=1898957 RepID=UPI00391B7D33
MTPLAAHLVRRIAAQGPIRLSDYMAECLLHPAHGYYTRAEPFGAGGDFITAPEISQMFGELLGLWLAQCWLDQGAPGRFVLAEPGPGRGTLMADVLRATRRVPGFHAAARVVLVEASPRLRAVQAARLAPWPVEWADTVQALPEGPLFLLANEFFDALPVRQFTRAGRGWAETLVTVQGGALALARGAPRGEPALAHRLADTREGDVVELCPAAPPIMAEIAGRIAAAGGAALVVDYGGWHSLGDTVQAMRRHAPAGLLDTPGEADLTAHVDFEPLAQAATAAGARAHGPVAQGALLERLGIGLRTARLTEGLTTAQAAGHIAAMRRLTHPDEMGTLFKALAVLPAQAPPAAGFAS